MILPIVQRTRRLGTPMNATRIAAILATQLFVAGCNSQESPGVETCERRISATGQNENMLSPQQPTSCKAVINFCNYCQYDAEGRLRGGNSKPCGVCVGWDF